MIANTPAAATKMPMASQFRSPVMKLPGIRFAPLTDPDGADQHRHDADDGEDGARDASHAPTVRAGMRGTQHRTRAQYSA